MRGEACGLTILLAHNVVVLNSSRDGLRKDSVSVFQWTNSWVFFMAHFVLFRFFHF